LHALFIVRRAQRFVIKVFEVHESLFVHFFFSFSHFTFSINVNGKFPSTLYLLEFDGKSFSANALFEETFKESFSLKTIDE
jgi:hypothetical protein